MEKNIISEVVRFMQSIINFSESDFLTATRSFIRIVCAPTAHMTDERVNRRISLYAPENAPVGSLRAI